MQLPTLDQIADLPVAYTLVAPPEFQDYNGHVNVSRHHEMHMYTCEAAFGEWGFDVETIASSGVTTFSAEQHLWFTHEVHVGDEIHGYVRWLGRGGKTLHGVSILVNATTHQVASICEFVEVSIDLNARRPAPLPDHFIERIDALIEQHASLDWALPSAGAMGVR